MMFSLILSTRTPRACRNNFVQHTLYEVIRRIGDKIEEEIKSDRIFISHGRSEEWRKLQAYLEKDLGKNTLELAQEANLGRTVLQKLFEESRKCSIAVIVMTGDDITEDGEIRARENVMHEIGFFQGLYGLNNIVLLLV